MNVDKILLRDDAARWVARMDRADWNEDGEADLAAWLATNPRAQGELLRVQAAWISLDMDAIVPAQQRQSRPISMLRRRTVLAGGAAAMAASLAGVLVYDGKAEQYDTEVGEIRRVALADGSTAAINTDSSIAVRIDKRLRTVRLNTGEAWFQVKSDRARPFVVEAGPVRVRAVGTAFSVRRMEGGAEIVVTEGVVAAWTDESANEPVSAHAGMHLFVPDRPGPMRPVAVEATDAGLLSWRSGQIELTARPLDQAAAEFNRYNRRKIVINDPAIAKEQVDGIFRTDDPEGFATAVHHALGVPLNIGSGEKITLGKNREQM